MRKVIPVKGMQQHELDLLTWVLEESSVLFHSLVGAVIDVSLVKWRNQKRERLELGRRLEVKELRMSAIFSSKNAAKSSAVMED